MRGEPEGVGSVASVTYLDTFDASTSLRNQQALKPFHRFAVDNGAGSEVIVSERTGDVLQAAGRIERGMYYAGNWVRLFRPLDAIGLGDSRRDVLTWLGCAAFVAGG